MDIALLVQYVSAVLYVIAKIALNGRELPKWLSVEVVTVVFVTTSIILNIWRRSRFISGTTSFPEAALALITNKPPVEPAPKQAPVQAAIVYAPEDAAETRTIMGWSAEDMKAGHRANGEGSFEDQFVELQNESQSAEVDLVKELSSVDGVIIFYSEKWKSISQWSPLKVLKNWMVENSDVPVILIPLHPHDSKTHGPKIPSEFATLQIVESHRREQVLPVFCSLLRRAVHRASIWQTQAKFVWTSALAVLFIGVLTFGAYVFTDLPVHRYLHDLSHTDRVRYGTEAAVLTRIRDTLEKSIKNDPNTRADYKRALAALITELNSGIPLKTSGTQKRSLSIWVRQEFEHKQVFYEAIGPNDESNCFPEITTQGKDLVQSSVISCAMYRKHLVLWTTRGNIQSWSTDGKGTPVSDPGAECAEIPGMGWDGVTCVPAAVDSAGDAKVGYCFSVGDHGEDLGNPYFRDYLFELAAAASVLPVESLINASDKETVCKRSEALDRSHGFQWPLVTPLPK